MQEKTIYFHVGLGKTASTYLQHKFFPHLRGIHYLGPTSFWKYQKHIKKSKHRRILISRELDLQFEPVVRSFTEHFPNTRIIMVLRRQDDWIASQYRRYVKNGFAGTFREFIDLHTDQGFWKQQDLYFQPFIDIVRQCTKYTPIVLDYKDLRQRPLAFMKVLATEIQAEFDVSEISLSRVHSSFSDKQLLILRSVVRKTGLPLVGSTANRVKNWLTFRPVWALYHLILYFAALIPAGWVNQKLISASELDRVREFYKEDWRSVKKHMVRLEDHVV